MAAARPCMSGRRSLMCCCRSFRRGSRSGGASPRPFGSGVARRPAVALTLVETLQQNKKMLRNALFQEVAVGLLEPLTDRVQNPRSQNPVSAPALTVEIPLKSRNDIHQPISGAICRPMPLRRFNHGTQRLTFFEAAK